MTHPNVPPLEAYVPPLEACVPPLEAPKNPREALVKIVIKHFFVTNITISLFVSTITITHFWGEESLCDDR